jgi:guanylate kinase
MANQRDPRKRRVTIWLLPEERRMLQRLARETGGNMTEVIKNRIAAYARKKKNAKP